MTNSVLVAITFQTSISKWVTVIWEKDDGNGEPSFSFRTHGTNPSHSTKGIPSDIEIKEGKDLIAKILATIAE